MVMAYRELGVINVREVLRRFGLGDGLRAIARGTGSDRKTVAKYVAAAVALGLQRGDPPLSDEQITAVIAAVRATGGRPAAVPDRLTAHRDQIAAWLAEGLRLTIYRRLRARGSCCATCKCAGIWTGCSRVSGRPIVSHRGRGS
jgi:hypothetical protein